MTDTSQKIKADKNDISSLVDLEDGKAKEELVEFAQKFDDASLDKIPLSFWAKLDFYTLYGICLTARSPNCPGLSALLDKCLAIMYLHDPEDGFNLGLWRFLAKLPYTKDPWAWEKPLMIKATEQVLRGSRSWEDIREIVFRTMDSPEEYGHLRGQAFLKYLDVAENVVQILYISSAGLCRDAHFTESEQKSFEEKLKNTATSLVDWGLIIETYSEPQGRLLNKKDFWVYAMKQIFELADTAIETELRQVLKAIADMRFNVFPKEEKE